MNPEPEAVVDVIGVLGFAGVLAAAGAFALVLLLLLDPQAVTPIDATAITAMTAVIRSKPVIDVPLSVACDLPRLQTCP
jgi:hypothetical protein